MKYCLKSNCCPSKLKRKSRLSFLHVGIIAPVAINLSMLWIISIKSSVVFSLIWIFFCAENIRSRRKNNAVSIFSWLISILHAKFRPKLRKSNKNSGKYFTNNTILCCYWFCFTDSKWQNGSVVKCHLFSNNKCMCKHVYEQILLPFKSMWHIHKWRSNAPIGSQINENTENDFFSNANRVKLKWWPKSKAILVCISPTYCTNIWAVLYHFPFYSATCLRIFSSSFRNFFLSIFYNNPKIYFVDSITTTYLGQFKWESC